MIASMFTLDHRLAELRPSEDEQRIARQLREAVTPATRSARSAGEPSRSVLGSAALTTLLTRLVAF